MTRMILGLLLVVPIALAGCAGIEVNVDADPAVDFSKYRTFAQAPPPAAPIRNLPGYSEIRGREIQERIARELEAKGYRKVARSEAQLIVAFTASGEPRTDVWKDYDWYGGRPVATTHYIAGALAIDVFDRALKKLVWHGWATADIFSLAEGRKKGDQALEELLRRFPPEEIL